MMETCWGKINFIYYAYNWNYRWILLCTTREVAIELILLYDHPELTQTWLLNSETWTVEKPSKLHSASTPVSTHLSVHKKRSFNAHLPTAKANRAVRLLKNPLDDEARRYSERMSDINRCIRWGNVFIILGNRLRRTRRTSLLTWKYFGQWFHACRTQCERTVNPRAPTL